MALVGEVLTARYTVASRSRQDQLITVLAQKYCRVLLLCVELATKCSRSTCYRLTGRQESGSYRSVHRNQLIDSNRWSIDQRENLTVVVLEFVDTVVVDHIDMTVSSVVVRDRGRGAFQRMDGGAGAARVQLALTFRSPQGAARRRRAARDRRLAAAAAVRVMARTVRQHTTWDGSDGEHPGPAGHLALDAALARRLRGERRLRRELPQLAINYRLRAVRHWSAERERSATVRLGVV